MFYDTIKAQNEKEVIKMDVRRKLNETVYFGKVSSGGAFL